MDKVKAYIRTLITEGTRVFWTGVEAASGVLAAFNLPEPTWAGSYGPALKGAVVVAVAALVTYLKESARRHLSRTV